MASTAFHALADEDKSPVAVSPKNSGAATVVAGNGHSNGHTAASSASTPLSHSETKESKSTPSEQQSPLILAEKTRALGDPVVMVRDLTKHFQLAGRSETVHALKSIDLNESSAFGPIRQGEFVMIRGPSGGGKTTLLNILGTIDEPSAGTLEIFGQRVDAKSKDAFLADLRLRRIGFVFQTFNLLATMSAFENVELPMSIMGKLSKADTKKRAMKLLDMVGLQDRYSHLPSELSGGEQQRVTIARALANEPAMLLLDEPTGDLDTRNTIDIMDLILSINQSQLTTCVMVTHNPDLECYADRILYVEDGRFKKQAVNRCQAKLHYDRYVKWVNEQSD